MTGFYFILKSRKQDRIVKKYLFGIGLFFLFYGIYRTILLLFEMTFKPTPTWQITGLELEFIFTSNPELNQIYNILWRITTALSRSGLVFMIYVLELHLMEKKTKFIFTIIQIITLIPSVIFGISSIYEVSYVRILLYIGTGVALVIPLFYLFLAIKTSGDTRKRALGAGIGITILLVGEFLLSAAIRTVFEDLLGINGIVLTYILFSSLVIVGLIIYIKSIRY